MHRQIHDMEGVVEQFRNVWEEMEKLFLEHPDKEYFDEKYGGNFYALKRGVTYQLYPQYNNVVTGLLYGNLLCTYAATKNTKWNGMWDSSRTNCKECCPLYDPNNQNTLCLNGLKEEICDRYEDFLYSETEEEEKKAYEGILETIRKLKALPIRKDFLKKS